MRSRSGVALAVLAAVIALAAAGCAGCKEKGKRGPSPERTGLAVVPSTAEVIVGIDMKPVAASPLVERALAQLVQQEPLLGTRWQALRDECKLDLKQVQRLMIALGPPPAGGKFGTGPMILIAIGTFSEPELVKCVREIVGKGGGSLVVKTVEGRSLYQMKEANRTMFLAFGRADTVILGNSDAYVLEAIGDGKKALANPELASWLQTADQNAPIWAVGRVAERLKTGLVRVSDGKLKAGPSAFIGSLDLSAGFGAELKILMASGGDANELKALVSRELPLLTWAAQVKSLAKVVNKLTVTAEGSTVRLSLPLTIDDVNHVLTALDPEPPAKQDSPPLSGSGSASPQ